MPRFAVIDPYGVGLSWATQLMNEGNEVMYYQQWPYLRGIGQGLVPTMGSMHALLAWAKEKPTIAFFCGSGMSIQKKDVPLGTVDFERAGVPVVGGGAFCDRLENDRPYGVSVAEDAGIRTPPTFEFSSIGDAIDFCKGHPKDDYYFKSTGYISSDATQGGSGETLVRYLKNLREDYGNNKRNIVQRKIPGIALSSAMWWNGSTFLQPVEHTIEHKKAWNDDLGPSTGCSFNVVWMDHDSKLFKDLHFEKLAEEFKRKKAPPCLYDVNSIVAEKDGPWGPGGVPYFLEWTPRMGWDSEVTSPLLLKMPLSEFLTRLIQGRLEEAPFTDKKIAYGVRLSLSPYPWEDNRHAKKTVEDAPLFGMQGASWSHGLAGYHMAWDKEKGFYMPTPDGLLGVAVKSGTQLQDLHKEVMEFVKGLEPKSMQYRTDGGKVLRADAQKLDALGYSVPKGLL